MKILLVKMSSLGDVVHCLPAVSDLAAAGHEIHWVVEEAFAAIPAAHPGVTRVIPIAWRRWRGQLRRNLPELRAFVRELRQVHYDLIIDAQGLYKSAILVRLAAGKERVGLDFLSAREGAASLFYSRRVAVPTDQHAVDRLRQLVAQAVYAQVPALEQFRLTLSEQPPAQIKDAGWSPPDFLLLHGTTWGSKHWPEIFWIELAQRIGAAGFSAMLTFGNAEERRRAERICRHCDATLMPPQSLADLMHYLAGARWVVGVDSGLLHLAAALGARTIGLYGSTDHHRTGVRGTAAQNLAAHFHCSPCLNRQCRYQGPPVYHNAQMVAPACYSSITPDRIWQIIEQGTPG